MLFQTVSTSEEAFELPCYVGLLAFGSLDLSYHVMVQTINIWEGPFEVPYYARLPAFGSHYMIPPKFNFSGIGCAANHYTWTEMTTFYSDPTYYQIFVGFKWILPLHPFFHYTLYRHCHAFHSYPTIVGFYQIPLNLATPFNFFIYSHAYIFQNMFQFIKIFCLHQYYLFPYMVLPMKRPFASLMYIHMR